MSPVVTFADPNLRRRMVDELEERGAIRSPAMREAFLRVPRELFVPVTALREGPEAVYRNEVIVTKVDAHGRPVSSSSQPQLMAAMLERLELRPGLHVLELGTGTGYNAALLTELVGPSGRVVTIEIDADVARAAEQALRAGGYPAVVVRGDGWSGDPVGAGYDRIVVTASSATIPTAWRDQLVDGGLLQVPLRLREGVQAVVTFQRRGRELASTEVLFGRFMELRGAADGSVRAPASLLATDSRSQNRVLVHLSGSGVEQLSAASRRRLLGVALSDPRRRALGVRCPTWDLVLYLSLEIPSQRLVQRLPELSVGLASSDGRGLALVRGSWGTGHVVRPQRVVAYGTAAAEDDLLEVLRRWRLRGRPGMDELRVGVSFRAGRGRLRHWWIDSRGDG